jgi:hypothetical protein
MTMDLEESLAELRSHLTGALSAPAALFVHVAAFLQTYDTLPEEIDALKDPRWIAIHDAAYELRYYQPGEADDDSVFLDQAAALDRVQQAVEQSS